MGRDESMADRTAAASVSGSTRPGAVMGPANLSVFSVSNKQIATTRMIRIEHRNNEIRSAVKFRELVTNCL
jgi:hypothetical protein